MLEIGWSEMLVIAIVLIVIVGPKDLPRMLRTFGKTTAKMRSMAGDFRKQFDDAMKEAELDDLKTLAADARKLNPAGEIKKALSPMDKAAQDVRAGLDKAMNPAKPAVVPPADEAAKVAEPAKTGPAAIPGESATPAAPAKTSGAATPAATPPKPAPAAEPAKTSASAARKPAAKPAAKAKAAPKAKAASAPKGGKTS